MPIAFLGKVKGDREVEKTSKILQVNKPTALVFNWLDVTVFIEVLGLHLFLDIVN